MPASAISRPSSSWSGPARARARRSTPPCSRPRARLDAPWSARSASRPAANDDRWSKAMTTTGARTLAHLSRTILLVGAGKMGGALLEGWLALGLDPKYAAVLEPQPSRELTGLAGRGLRLNPTPRALGQGSAVLLAGKPPIASHGMPA